MNFLTALQSIMEDNKLWARPKGSKVLHGYVFHKDIQGFEEVMGKSGGKAALIPNTYLLFGEWEVFNPSLPE